MMKEFIQKTGNGVIVLTDMFNLIKDCIFLMEADNDSFRYVYINNSAQKLLNTQEKIIGSRIEDLLSKERSEKLMKQYREVVQTFKTVEFTETIELNGQLFSGETSLNPILTENGQCRYIVAIVRDITDHVQKEKELAEAKRGLEHHQKRIQSLIEQNKDAVFEMDLAGCLIRSNNMMVSLTGFSQEELKGKPLISLMEEKSANVIFDQIEKGEAAETNIEIESWWMRKDGSPFFIRLQLIPIVMDQRLSGFYGIAKDSTEEKQIREELQKTNVDLKAFWNSSVDPIFMMSTEGVIEKANPAFESTFGYGKNEWNTCASYMVPKELQDETSSVFKRVRSGETIEMVETKRWTKSGELIDVIGSYAPVYSRDQIIGMMAFYKDISELKRTEWELRKSRSKYRIILNHVSDAISILTDQCKIDYTSPSTERILGYAKPDFVGHPFLEFVHPEDVSAVDEQFEQLLTGSPIHFEARVLHQSGHYIWMDISATPVMEEDTLLQIVMIADDITDRKKVQKRLEEMAFFDYLSGLPNRRMFDEKLKDAINEAEEFEKKVAVMMLDGHEFKLINDTFGHDAGDAVIKEIAVRLQACIRESDTAARLGGDEMGIILSSIDSFKTAEAVAQRIVDSFKEPVLYKGEEINIGAEIGIAYYPDHAEEEKQLVKCADEALYEAKEKGTSSYLVYEKERGGGGEIE